MQDVVLDSVKKQFNSCKEAEGSVLGVARGNKEVRKLLVALFSSLLGNQDYNETDPIKNLWDPFLKTYLEPIADCKGCR